MFAQVLGGVGRGVLPTLDGGPGLTIGVQGSHWRALAGAYVLFSPATRLAERDGAGVRFLHPGGELGACYQLREASVVAPICLGTQVGAVRAQGFGLDLDMTAWRPYVGVGAEVAVVWPADAPVRLAARLGTQATLLAPRFHVTGLGPIHQSSPITGRLSVGVEVRMSRRNRNRPTPPLTGRSP